MIPLTNNGTPHVAHATHAQSAVYRMRLQGVLVRRARLARTLRLLVRHHFPPFLFLFLFSLLLRYEVCVCCVCDLLFSFFAISAVMSSSNYFAMLAGNCLSH